MCALPIFISVRYAGLEFDSPADKALRIGGAPKMQEYGGEHPMRRQTHALPLDRTLGKWKCRAEVAGSHQPECFDVR